MLGIAAAMWARCCSPALRAAGRRLPFGWLWVPHEDGFCVSS